MFAQEKLLFAKSFTEHVGMCLKGAERNLRFSQFKTLFDWKVGRAWGQWMNFDLESKWIELYRLEIKWKSWGSFEDGTFRLLSNKFISRDHRKVYQCARAVSARDSTETFETCDFKTFLHLRFVKPKLSQSQYQFRSNLRSALRRVRSRKTLHVNDPALLFSWTSFVQKRRKTVNKEKLLKTFVCKFLDFLLLFSVAFVGFLKNTFS